MEHILDIIGGILQLFSGVSFKREQQNPNSDKQKLGSVE